MFIEWLQLSYLWIKSFHLIAVICWFAALFYLPRLFVYHADAKDDISNERFKVMERKLYKGIANPSMMVSIILGVLLLTAVPGHMSGGWMHVKLLFVALVVAYHIMCKRHLTAFAENRNEKNHVYFRWFNEVPILFLIVIVILVIVKPF